MSNQQRPFSWFRLAPFGRQLQPAPAPTPPPTPRPTAFRAPAPPPTPRPTAFRAPAPQPRPTIRPTAPPAVTSPPPPPTRTLFPSVTTTTTTVAQPGPRSPTPSTAPGSPAKSIPASPIIKLAPSSSPTSPTLLPITSSSFTLRSPETKTPAPPAPSPAATATVTAPTTATTTLSSRIFKPSNKSPPKPLFRSPAQARAAPQEDKKLMLGQETAGNSKMNEKSSMDNKKDSTKFEKLPRRLVTLIGENKGAIMILNPNSTKKSSHVFGGKSQTIGNREEGEMGSKKNKEEQNDMNTMEMEESTLFINSNVQGVNNSILDDSSVTDHDPGFHIFFSTD